MVPAIDFTTTRHGYPISPEQALMLLRGQIGQYYKISPHQNKPWRLELRQQCIEVAWRHLLDIHAGLGVTRLHLAMCGRSYQYPHVELITTSRKWWDRGSLFLKSYEPNAGHGGRDIGVGYPIYSRTVEYRYFSTLEEGEYNTESGKRLGDPLRYITDNTKWY